MTRRLVLPLEGLVNNWDFKLGHNQSIQRSLAYINYVQTIYMYEKAKVEVDCVNIFLFRIQAWAWDTGDISYPADDLFQDLKEPALTEVLWFIGSSPSLMGIYKHIF